MTPAEAALYLSPLALVAVWLLVVRQVLARAPGAA